MNTVLIDLYLENRTKKQREKILDVMEYIQSRVENSVVASVFTLPGFTIDYIPLCNIKATGKRITVRFFQKDVFSVISDRLEGTGFILGRCSLTFEDTNLFKCETVDELLKLTASSAKVDASFMKSVIHRDYGYYDSRLLSEKRKK